MAQIFFFNPHKAARLRVILSEQLSIFGVGSSSAHPGSPRIRRVRIKAGVPPRDPDETGPTTLTAGANLGRRRQANRRGRPCRVSRHPFPILARPRNKAPGQTAAEWKKGGTQKTGQTSGSSKRKRPRAHTHRYSSTANEVKFSAGWALLA